MNGTPASNPAGAAPSPLLVHLFEAHERQWGEPSMHYPFTPQEAAEGTPLERLDVFVWHPSAETPVTTFATIGMAVRPMTGAAHRAELHLTVQTPLDDAQESGLATFLANLAAWPHRTGGQYDWWRVLAGAGPVAPFGHCPHMLLHPRFRPDGWDTVEFEGLTVKLLNVVPLNEREAGLIRERGLADALNQLFAEHVNLFADRP